MENSLGFKSFIFYRDAQSSDDFLDYNAWVYTPGGSPKKCGLHANVVVYVHFGGLPKTNKTPDGKHKGFFVTPCLFC